jgi:hypothetical protein
MSGPTAARPITADEFKAFNDTLAKLARVLAETYEALEDANELLGPYIDNDARR